MSMDREILEQYKSELADRYNATELIELMEDCDLISVWDILEQFEEKIVELKFR